MRSIMLRFACAVGFTMAAPALAHEHMYIGSDQPHGGALVLRYDFNRAFPLSPDPTGDGFLGTDPAFNSQVTDDPASGIYRRSEEHTSELQSLRHLVCRLLL